MIISFSIYGDNPKYTIGLLKNIRLAKELFPNWRIYIYYDNSVPQDILNKCVDYKLIDMTGSSLPGMFWRFLPKGRFIVRDTDSRLSKRDVIFVKKWLKSGKDLHIIKDHPEHLFYKILGGMWGMNNIDFDMEAEMLKYCKDKGYQKDNFMGDMDFLRDVVYPKFSKYYSIGVFTKDFIGRVYDESDDIERPHNDKIINKIKALIKYLKKCLKKYIKQLLS